MPIDYRIQIESGLDVGDLVALAQAVEVSVDTSAATGEVFHRCTFDGGAELSAKSVDPALRRLPSPFGMVVTSAFSGYPRPDERHDADVLQMAEAAARIITASECRGYATYIDPIHFFWDRDLVVVNTTSIEPEATAELFRERGLSPVLHALDLDVGFPTVQRPPA